jgi:predicted metal-dependent phosphoesterase TrpH
MAAQLAQVGIHGAYEGALQFVGNPELVSRTHFARFLVETRVCRDTPRCFANTWSKASPATCRTAGPLGDAVRWITEAGGVAVIAHPARYKLHGQRGIRAVLRIQGPRRPGRGSGHRQPQRGRIRDLRRHGREFGLAASRGSDFHSPDESHTDLGTLPLLPGTLTPVWELLAERMHPA